jgi:hypothetical protein
VFAAGACCPHPPLLHPAVAQSTDAGLEDLRTACGAAVSTLLAAAPDVVVCVGDGPEPGRYDESDGGALRGFGVDARAGGDGSDALPLALTLGAWLLDRAGWGGPRRYVALPQETTPQRCVHAGRRAAAADLRVGVLAMGDGSARRSAGAPGYLDERAAPFDAAVARALGAPDPEWLADGLPPIACAELWVAGRPAWQFLAGAATEAAHEGGLTARVRYDAAPYGVGYLVAEWVPAPASG